MLHARGDPHLLAMQRHHPEARKHVQHEPDCTGRQHHGLGQGLHRDGPPGCLHRCQDPRRCALQLQQSPRMICHAEMARSQGMTALFRLFDEMMMKEITKISCLVAKTKTKTSFKRAIKMYYYIVNKLRLMIPSVVQQFILYSLFFLFFFFSFFLEERGPLSSFARA
jgi:hypothetical protein